MNKILEEACDAFYAEDTHLQFRKVAEAHAVGLHSYLVRTEVAYVMAREVPASWREEAMTDYFEESSQSNHMHVTLAVGNLLELVGMIPPHIETISFQRRGYGVHRVTVARLRRWVDFKNRRQRLKSAGPLTITTAAALLKETLKDVMDAHRSPKSPDYNECEKEGEECQWCMEAQQLLDFFLKENA